MEPALPILLSLALATTAGAVAGDIILVRPSEVTAATAAAWKSEGFTGAALLLEGNMDPGAIKLLRGARLEFHLWIEVARHPQLADTHPRWMASLGVHDDWQKRFPKVAPPKPGEVAKAWPWVPIWYHEAFDAQLARVLELIDRAPPGWRGVLLNDLQAGPSSCGCGNLQCRWATDYHVPATGERLEGDDVPARFLAAVRAHVPGEPVVPVWTTECEHEDMPSSKRDGAASTGLCGGVGCAVGLCPKEFTKQWSPVIDATDGPVALLGLHGEFGRDRKEHGFGAAWLTNAVGYLDRVPPAHGGKALSHGRLWIVVQGYATKHEKAARQLARELGAATVIVARTKLDQSYEPRVIAVK
jgi:hypothetical protein